MSEITKDSVLLFTGGGKGITAQCAIALSAVLPCKFVLMGRTPKTDLPVWFAENDTEQAIKQQILTEGKQNGKRLSPKEIEQKFRQIKGSHEISSTISQIEQNDAKAYYIAADVTDLDDVKQSLATIIPDVGPITGLVHGAGRLADKRIERKTEEDFQAVYGTKVDGLRTVLNCLDSDQLDLLVLFSSVAGAFGNAGQADYAMANEYLTKFAYQFKASHPNCHTIAINWGPWDSGMVNATLKDAFSKIGITLISIQEGTQQFVQEIIEHTHQNPQIVFGSTIERSTKLTIPSEPIIVKRVIIPDENSFLLDHQIGSNRVLPATCAAGWIADTCEKLFPSYHFFELQKYKVQKGLVFSDNTAHEYLIHVKVTGSKPDETIQLEVTVTSEIQDREIIHYKAAVLLQKKLPPPPTRQDLLKKANLSAIKDGQYFYGEKILFHGPAFRGLKSVLRVTEDELTTVCHLPRVPEIVQGQFPAEATNPYANDVVLQGILAWSFHNHKKVCLPAGIDQIIQYKPLPFDQDIVVDVKITSQSKTRAKADAVVFDQQGHIYMIAKGVEGTMSKALRALFKESATSMDSATSNVQE